jgi:glycosyltransferase involved in cell wall biosynthesis
VLAPTPNVYERVDVQGLDDIADPERVFRSRALDTRRHMGFRGRYSSWLAAPDRWIWWWPTAVTAGLRLIRQHQIQAIWSTYPIATTHLIAWTLARLTGLPWIADFRDPVVPAGTSIQRRAAKFVERSTLARADRIVFTTPGAMKRYADRFPALAEAGRFAVVPNGYEDSVVSKLEQGSDADSPDTQLHLVHSGLLYSQGRNPQAFFEALSQLQKAGVINPENLAVSLRASGYEEEYQPQIDRLGIGDLVRLLPPVAYRKALQEQASAHGLLLFQGSEFNAQIPAKIFEYLRIARPVFALTDSRGDTAELLRQTGGAMLAPMTNATAIAEALSRFLDQLRARTFPAADMTVLKQYSRDACTRRLSDLLDEITR